MSAGFKMHERRKVDDKTTEELIDILEGYTSGYNDEIVDRLKFLTEKNEEREDIILKLMFANGRNHRDLTKAAEALETREGEFVGSEHEEFVKEFLEKYFWKIEK